ncbi:proton channel OtopLc-like [Chrysoperla carnea]|uniref:proton channel OtopLc-like n=1 Tax=Chrysoperla carnea TaxID=189513 RepID=UPI001D06FDCD|nr:proton channel OtopLc-like [Chrysoperla carnea]
MRPLSQLTTILSSIYCVFVVTLGVVIYISDIILQNTSIAETFSIYLILIGFCYVVYLYVDIRLYLNKVKLVEVTRAFDRRCEHTAGFTTLLFNTSSTSTCSTTSPTCEYFSPPSINSIQNSSSILSSLQQYQQRHQKHDYCFDSGRHSGSFYLKTGAAGFCLGHLIHSGLLLGYQIVLLTKNGNNMKNTDNSYSCVNIPTVILDIVYPVYSFLQLYFIFKYSNVIINRNTDLARFGMMHCIASSLCFWIWTILRETMDSFTHHYYKNKMHETAVSQRPTSDDHCFNKFLGINQIYENISPYLYPFTVEYSILIVGVLYIIWRNIGYCIENQNDSDRKGCSNPPPLTAENGFTSNLVIHADCHSSNKGLFAGIIILVSSLISIILFFLAISNEEFIDDGLFINTITELILLILMTISGMAAYRQISKLDINPHPISLLDDLLLFICIPAFFLYAIFSIVPAVRAGNMINIVNIMLNVLQILVQTPFIIDGLRRCSNSQQLRLEKPGRELITFLVVCNVAMWIIETFEVKSNDLQGDAFDFYGQVLWTIISHLTVPLTMFYRFHSSVCLADIWKSAYEPANHL